MGDFDPNWPHGHVTRDGRKAELRGRLDDYWLVVVTERDGRQWVLSVCHDGRWVADKETDYDVLNAPAPKRTWEVVALKYPDESVGFWNTEFAVPQGVEIIGRYTLPEGEGMEGGDG